MRSFSFLALFPFLAVALTGCNSLQNLSVTPAVGMVKMTAVGQTAQYKAVGTYQMGSAPTTTGDATGSVNWSSSAYQVAVCDKLNRIAEMRSHSQAGGVCRGDFQQALTTLRPCG
jgi:hypothetical protein